MEEFLSQNVYLDYFLRLVASLICGLALGLERKMKQHSVGIRTLTLLSISSAMLSILSSYMASSGLVSGDPTRISAAIVTGIGFLGAGVIVNQGLNIRGLTSASITFTASALGVTCGAGLYFPAAIVLFFSFITLFFIDKIERKIFPAEKRKILTIIFNTHEIDENKIKSIISECGIIIHDLDIFYTFNDNATKLVYTVHSPDSLNSTKFLNEFSKISGITKVELSKN